MSQINELEGRLSAALDRIGAGLEKLDASGAAEAGDTGALAAIEAQLAEERTANAQLEERIKTVTKQRNTRIAALEEELSLIKQTNGALEEAMAGLRAAHARLEETSHGLRIKLGQNLAEGADINAALEAELDATRAARALDVAEAAAVLYALRPKFAPQTEAQPADAQDTEAQDTGTQPETGSASPTEEGQA